MSRAGLAAVLLVAGCEAPRSAMRPVGPAARTLAELGWPVLIGFLAVSAVVWGLLVWVVARNHGSFAEHAPLHDRHLGMSWVAIAGFVLPGITFAAIFVATLRVMDRFPHAHHEMKPEIRITGRQWWWDVEYLDGPITLHVHDANEIHIPIGRPVEIELDSVDVIHSFWAPRLHGKVDLVPGLHNHISVEASQAGDFPGACAEYCGMEHANMRFVVVAEAPAAHAQFLERLRTEAPTPTSVEATRGQALFLSGPCAACHTVRGTPAKGTVGPDLTHFAARRTIAAGMLPRDLATEHAWVANAPSLKPGTRMPAMTRFDGEELAAIVTYLESLR
jgi:cytochrome c oxidase subunit 2